MEKLDHSLLNLIKQGFVPGDPSQGGAPMGGDPAAQGGAPMGGDPAAGGDPNAQPAPMPPSGMDPAMAGMMGGAPAPGGAAPSGSSTITIDEMIKLFKLFKGNEGGAPAAQPAPSGDPRLDHIITLLQGARGG